MITRDNNLMGVVEHPKGVVGEPQLAEKELV